MSRKQGWVIAFAVLTLLLFLVEVSKYGISAEYPVRSFSRHLSVGFGGALGYILFFWFIIWVIRKLNKSKQ